MVMTNKEEFLAAKLRELSESFAKTIPAKLAEMTQALQDCQLDPSERNKGKRLHRLLHTMAGSAGTFGFITLGRSAALIENHLLNLLDSNNWNADELPALAAKVEALVAWATLDPKNGPTVSIAGERGYAVAAPSRRTLDPKIPAHARLLYVLDAQPPCNAYLVSELENFGYQVNLFSDLPSLQAAIADSMPVVLIVDMGCQLDIAELSASIPEQVLRICIADNGQFETRLSAVNAHADGYFVRPVNMMALAGRIEDMLRREERMPYRILIVDDDAFITDFYSAVLRSAGMEVVVLHDPANIFDALAEHRPDLLLMDVYMPKCSGPHLAQIVRQERMYIDMPIVFLSTENNLGKQLDAVRSGADDFLTKPIPAAYLISSITSRVERYRGLRDLILRDSLTRLYNHSSITEQATLELERAKRHHKPMALALLDLDYFKNVNDNYGHSVGDNVISSLGQLLLQLLRRVDIVGRFGGEEFAIIFPDTTAQAANQALEKVRACFANIKHHSADSQWSFCVTFSAGIVELQQQIDAKTLFGQALAALETAKHSGRNRICQFDDY